MTLYSECKNMFSGLRCGLTQRVFTHTHKEKSEEEEESTAEVDWGFNVEVQERYRVIGGIYTELQSLIAVCSSHKSQP